MTGPSMRSRLRGARFVLWHYVTGAPLTFIWLLLLLVTTIVQFVHAGGQLHSMLLARSTNIYALGKDPLDVLFSSLLWIDGKNHVEAYVLLFVLFLAPAEHWLGQLRWLTVGLTSHIVSTYFSEGLLYFAIQRHDAVERVIYARDIGVSYFMVGIIAALAYHIARPWRWPYLAVLLVIFGFPLIAMDRVELDFTAIGHFTSIVIGLSFYPLVRECDGKPLSPDAIKAAYRQSRMRDKTRAQSA